LFELFLQTTSEDVVLDVIPKTFNRANTCISGASWKVFQCRFPAKIFDEFWEYCTSYYFLHSYPLRYFMTMNNDSKIALVEPRAIEAPLVKEEPYLEGEEDHYFIFDLAKARGGWTRRVAV
jgi:hypothetical protein